MSTHTAPITATGLNGTPLSRNDCRTLAWAVRHPGLLVTGDTGHEHGPADPLALATSLGIRAIDRRAAILALRVRLALES